VEGASAEVKLDPVCPRTRHGVELDSRVDDARTNLSKILRCEAPMPAVLPEHILGAHPAFGTCGLYAQAVQAAGAGAVLSPRADNGVLVGPGKLQVSGHGLSEATPACKWASVGRMRYPPGVIAKSLASWSLRLPRACRQVPPTSV